MGDSLDPIARYFQRKITGTWRRPTSFEWRYEFFIEVIIVIFFELNDDYNIPDDDEEDEWWLCEEWLLFL